MLRYLYYLYEKVHRSKQDSLLLRGFESVVNVSMHLHHVDMYNVHFVLLAQKRETRENCSLDLFSI